MEKDFEPQKITITVVCGRQLQGRRKGETCRASVVFGLGKELFQTEEVESAQPFWNQEAHVNVTGKTNDSIKFKLKDQGHTVGIITLPISSLGRRKQEQWIPFQPYKKERSYHGDLCVSCYVSEVRPHIEHSPVNSRNSSSEDVSPGGGVSFKRGHFDRRSPPGGKMSSSDSDIRKDNYLNTSSGGGSHGGDEDTRSRDSSIESESSQVPEVTGISPSEGSTEGNEKIILRGTNLGENKTDVIRVMLDDVDCTSKMEYFSSGKLVVTTLPRHAPSSGPVVVETRSGGVGVSSLHFTYCNKSSSLADRSKPDLLGGGGGGGGNRKYTKLTDQEILDLQMENKSLKLKIKELKDSNNEMSEEITALKAYVERLLSTIIANKPELLELAKE